MDITMILEGVLTIAIALITTFLAPYLKEKYGEQKISSAYSIIKILVNAIEQTTTIAGQGKKKKEWVKERLNYYNIKIDSAKVDEMIEGAVKEMNSLFIKE